MVTRTVTVYPYVKKFINARYGQDTWEVSKQDRIGKAFYFMLDRMPKLYKRSKLDLGDTLRVSICDEYEARRGTYISDESILEFNDIIKLEIIESIAMYAYQVKNKTGLKKYTNLFIRQNTPCSSKIKLIRDPDLYQYLEKREIIYDILALYGITEDDLSMDTVRKAWQRLKLPMLIAS